MLCSLSLYVDSEQIVFYSSNSKLPMKGLNPNRLHLKGEAAGEKPNNGGIARR